MKSRGVPKAATVYSTDRGRMCPECGQPVAVCRCRRAGGRTVEPKVDGTVRVGRQTQGRKGKQVTVVTGVPLAGEALVALARQLKELCGAGGTVKAGAIEIQGDHRDRVVAALQGKGWTVKRAGG